MVRIHTAQLNVGKLFSSNSNVLFLDITVKSAKDLIGRSLAPTWDMVKAHKAGGCGKVYLAEYIPMISHKLEDMVVNSTFEWLLSKGGPYTDIVLGCYCSAGKFCHRHAAAKMLATTFNGELCGEIGRDSVKTTSVDGTTLYRVTSDASKEPQSLLDELGAMENVNILPAPLINANDDVKAIAMTYEKNLVGMLARNMINIDISGMALHTQPLICELSRFGIVPMLTNQIYGVSVKFGPLGPGIKSIKHLIENELKRTHVEITSHVLNLDFDAVFDTMYEEVYATLQEHE